QINHVPPRGFEPYGTIAELDVGRRSPVFVRPTRDQILEQREHDRRPFDHLDTATERCEHEPVDAEAGHRIEHTEPWFDATCAHKPALRAAPPPRDIGRRHDCTTSLALLVERDAPLLYRQI